jgi:hypothetical protein
LIAVVVQKMMLIMIIGKGSREGLGLLRSHRAGDDHDASCHLPVPVGTVLSRGSENDMKRLILMVIMLAGCSQSDANIYGSPFGQNIVGNEVSVQITNVWNQADAFPLADRHCRRHGRAARFTAMHGSVASFDCVKI